MRTTITFDGHDLTELFVVSNLRRPLAPRGVNTIDVPGRDGSLFASATQSAVTLSLTLTVLSRDLQERSAAIRTLAALLSTKEPKPLAISDDGGLYYMAVPSSNADGMRYINAEAFEVTFTCPDPCLYGEIEHYEPTGSTLTFTVGGTAPSSPTIVVDDATAGDGGFWRMVDETGAGIYAALDSGTHSISADCGARTITVDDNVVMLPPAFDWPVWAPGEHTVTITGGGSAVIQVQERWW